VKRTWHRTIDVPELHLLKPTTRCGVGVAPLEAWANPLSGFWRASKLGRVVILAARLF
jgi:hypothetical protein